MKTASAPLDLASLPADLQIEWNDKSIGLVAGGASMEFFEVITATEKAVQLHCKNLSKFPVWVPLAALEVKTITETVNAFQLKAWFVRKLWKTGKPWQRVALGLSVY